MMKNLKKALSLTLALALSLSLAAPALAVETSGPCGVDFSDDVTWSYNDNTLTIQGSGAIGMFNYGDYNEYGVLEVISSPWLIWGYCDEITTVEIKDGVTAIGDGAFEECYAMTSITIPASVTTIGGRAFYICGGLTDVYYSGTETQWQQISINKEENESLLNATIHYGVGDSGDVTPAEPEQPAAPSGISVTVGDKAVEWTDAAPFIDANSRTMVPLRAVADAMSLTVNWDGDTREASFSDGSKTIYFPIDSTSARTSDGNAVQMDTAAVIANERTYAPIRYLAEYFGYTVGWDGATQTVSITK